MQEQFRIGVISNTHGLKGEVKVFPTTDDLKRFQKLKKVQMVHPKMKQELEIQQVRFFKNMVILKFKGLDDINQVEKLKNAELYVDREDAIELQKNEFYIADMIGAKALLTDGSVLGEVVDMIRTGANDVFVVSSEQYGELLVPSIKECIKEIDALNSRVVMELMDGILPEETANRKNNKEDSKK